jgi:hypothetical protein
MVPGRHLQMGTETMQVDGSAWQTGTLGSMPPSPSPPPAAREQPPLPTIWSLPRPPRIHHTRPHPKPHPWIHDKKRDPDDDDVTPSLFSLFAAFRKANKAYGAYKRTDRQIHAHALAHTHSSTLAEFADIDGLDRTDAKGHKTKHHKRSRNSSFQPTTFPSQE